jgi:class 3 adenylate cyclase
LQQRWVSVPQSRYVAEHILGARLVELPGGDSSPFWETPDLILDHVEEFLTGVRQSGAPERMLVAVLFTDIVGSTERAAALGDAAWRALLDRHDGILREQVGLFGGKLADHAGDGSLSTFESPRRAIDCALALHGALGDIGIAIRVGVHFGEVERREDGGVGGVTVHIGARVMGCACAGEVLVSRTLRDILIGSRYEFSDHGMHEFKGVPDRWQIYAVGSVPK